MSQDNADKCKKPKTTEKQYEILLDFMSSNKNLLSARFSSSTTKITIKNLWIELTRQLNNGVLVDGFSALGPRKNMVQWKKVWADWKSLTRRKYRQVKENQGVTGGGPKTKIVLSPLEERLLNLIGRVGATGDDDIREPQEEALVEAGQAKRRQELPCGVRDPKGTKETDPNLEEDLPHERNSPNIEYNGDGTFSLVGPPQRTDCNTRQFSGENNPRSPIAVASTSGQQKIAYESPTESSENEDDPTSLNEHASDDGAEQNRDENDPVRREARRRLNRRQNNIGERRRQLNPYDRAADVFKQIEEKRSYEFKEVAKDLSKIRVYQERRAIADERRAIADERRAIADKRRAAAKERRAVAEERRAVAEERRVAAEATLKQAECFKKICQHLTKTDGSDPTSGGEE